MFRALVTGVAVVALCAVLSGVSGEEKAKPATVSPAEADVMSAKTFKGLELRSLGPALTAGRIGDIVVEPGNRNHYWVAAASGGVWKTTNAGTTWTPVFDDQGSYSIGALAMDPRNPWVVWVGTGERHSQRSVSYGDGVYRTLDGGAHWQKMGLEESEHVGAIRVDPRDSDVVWVAAQGPLWRSGGQRGLYQTSDGGQTWARMLHISDDTGVNEVHLDPRDPDVVYAVAYQRRRHVWTLVNGGPESGIHKSTDGGQTWRELSTGLPEVDLGRIGLCLSPADPDVVYAIVEAAQGESGVFRSSDRGETWERRSKYVSQSPQYYNDVVCDPSVVDRLYSLDTWLHRSEDGGKTFTKVGERYKHVDNHALWIDPANSDSLLAGCDGGVYESFDRGATWRFFDNLPVTQFYRVAVDSSVPFYFVYGGTQDNNTLGGPHRTLASSGIANEDWFTTVGGDGFETQVDPDDPSIVYSQSQHGGLVRFDRRSGEAVDIRPEEAPGEEPYRFNWDSPLILSPHSSTRLYFAAQKVFRSDDRGDSWRAISGDLSRRLDRNQLPVMGKVWGVDAVAKNASTSFYGNVVALSESPLVEGLIYVGTDDGLIQVTADGGASWNAVSSFPGVPELTYVSDLVASLHDADTVYAAFDNHKNGDFAPYLLKSSDRGRSWTSIAGDLPQRHVAWALVEDDVKPGLLFLGTELGLFFTVDGGGHWVELEGGLPTIAVRDLEIQRREGDLVLGTFGRGFYVLDDYSPLRLVDRALLDEKAILFPVRSASSYMETQNRRDSRGDGFFTAPNPPYGAVVTYYLKDKLLTRAERRREAEKAAEEAGKTPPYPSFDELRAEDREHEPSALLTVRDADGQVVRRLRGSREAGFHRVAWDLRFPSSKPTSLEEKKAEELAPWDRPAAGPHVLPGRYSVSLATEVDGAVTEVGQEQSFEVVPLGLATFPAADRDALLGFCQEAARLERAVHGAIEAAAEVKKRVDHLAKAILDTPAADAGMLAELRRVENELEDVKVGLAGDTTRSKRWEPAPTSIAERVDRVTGGLWYASSAPTATQRESLRHASEAFAVELARLRALVEARLEPLEATLEKAGGPWTPGRLPTWP